MNPTGTVLESTWKGIKSIITIKYISADNPKSFSVDGATISNPMAISNILLRQYSHKHEKHRL